jgi:hypothetical protein
VLIEFLVWPNLSRVSGEQSVTFVTRKPVPATLELDRDDIALAVVMRASRLWIDVNARDIDALNFHALRSRGQTSTSTAPMIQHAIIMAKPLLNEPLC